MSLLVAVLLALQLAAGDCLSAQEKRPALSELISRLSQVKDGGDLLFLVPLSESLASAPLAEIEANLPALIEFTDSPNPTVRSFALVSLTAIEGRRL